MAVITPDTFDALNQYVSVRLQQGVPLVDADWNALDDTRRFELRAFLKWYVGDGVPYGNDGFHIQSIGANDDFTIASGVTGTVDALTNVGRCLVNGLDVMITADVTFKAQPLHTSQPGGGRARRGPRRAGDRGAARDRGRLDLPRRLGQAGRLWPKTRGCSSRASASRAAPG